MNLDRWPDELMQSFMPGLNLTLQDCFGDRDTSSPYALHLHKSIERLGRESDRRMREWQIGNAQADRPVRTAPVVPITLTVGQTLELLNHLHVHLLAGWDPSGAPQTLRHYLRIEFRQELPEQLGVAG